MQGALLSGLTEKPQQRAFNPYSDNGGESALDPQSHVALSHQRRRGLFAGTILAISSKDFAIVASDTRQAEGYNIQTRTARRCYQLTDQVVIATVGFQADASNLVKRIKQRLEWYYHTHGEKPSLPSIARLVQTMLYGKRFFPYYAWVIRTSIRIVQPPHSHALCHSTHNLSALPTVGGIDRDGTGAVYSFDPVGSYERESCRAAGAAQSLVQPFLDNLVYGKNQVRDPALPALAKGERPAQPLETVLALVTDALTGAAEREIAVGDGLDVFTIVKGEAIKYRHIPLKKD
ncbi:BZ3500_MvSof-1268-A1-R1_Chr11-2g03335 [Microbotryum saponariae]|uniref:BZ3500_MvSof-1268-A1-R1_Chr11-2g03335 protein n=1 Tax=Microbotryum saponariae TaxID=289078 RepID=A0A2X0LDK5_9BASI|nr:BZ3500_MvSof-1268-A1-R1_Chr11-2g03335 [Microbotryum saponariae]SDA03150.1 BZ3501_MvSof-1269-A2-R1_Chr11g02906 [Microbotryum saponariae]